MALWPDELSSVVHRHFDIVLPIRQRTFFKKIWRDGLLYTGSASLVGVFILVLMLYVLPGTVYFQAESYVLNNFLLFGGMSLLLTVLLFLPRWFQNYSPKLRLPFLSAQDSKQAQQIFISILQLGSSYRVGILVLVYVVISGIYFSDALLPANGQLIGDWPLAIKETPGLMALGMFLLNIPLFGYVMSSNSVRVQHTLIQHKNEQAQATLDTIDFWLYLPRLGRLYHNLPLLEQIEEKIRKINKLEPAPPSRFATYCQCICDIIDTERNKTQTLQKSTEANPSLSFSQYQRPSSTTFQYQQEWGLKLWKIHHASNGQIEAPPLDINDDIVTHYIKQAKEHNLPADISTMELENIDHPVVQLYLLIDTIDKS